MSEFRYANGAWVITPGVYEYSPPSEISHAKAIRNIILAAIRPASKPGYLDMFNRQHFSMILIVVFLGYFLGVFDGSNIFPGFQLSEGVKKQGHPPFFIGSTFLTMVFLLFVISYWFISSQFEDVYTRLRSHLVGVWALKLQTWRLAEEQKWVREFMIHPVHLYIDQKNRQLKARIQQMGSELFDDQDFHTGNIHIDEYDLDSYDLEYKTRIDGTL